MIASKTTKLREKFVIASQVAKTGILAFLCVVLLGLGQAVFAQGGVALYSGTFDLPHYSHREIAERVAKEFELEKLFILVNPVSEHKTGISPLEDREAWVDTLFENTAHSAVEVQNSSLKLAFDEDDVSGVLRKIESTHKGKKIYQIMGMDSFERYLKVENPYRPDNFNLVVFSRFTRSKSKRRKRETIFRAFQKKHSEVHVHRISISSKQQKRSSRRIKRQLKRILEDTSLEVLAAYLSQCKQGFEKGNSE